MYRLEDIKEEFSHGSAWWVFPDGFHANQVYYPTKEEAVKEYVNNLQHDVDMWKSLI